MSSKINSLALAVVVCSAAGLHAQFNFRLDGHDVQVHSFASQAFAYSNDNNYLTMNTSSGSFKFTDVGFNAATQITDKFRVGAQFYTHSIGHLGAWEPTVDWALADYKFKDWFGVRGGKVKTVLGLYNDVQDMAFLHTWALVPSSVYPLDQRGETIAHIEADLYGNIDLKNKGGLSYTLYGGTRPSDPSGGVFYGLESATGNHVFDQAFTARLDLRSYLDLKIEGNFIDGTESSSIVNRGFYVINNPTGLAPRMHMLIVRLGYHM